MSMARARAEARTTTKDRLFLPEGGRGVTVTKKIPNTDGGNTSGEKVMRHNEATGPVYLMMTYE
jgi:hypothetical protein